MVDLASLTPNARALYWYLQATQAEQPVREIAKNSGIPASSVWAAAARYPDVFQLTGALLKTSPRTPAPVYTPEPQAPPS